MGFWNLLGDFFLFRALARLFGFRRSGRASTPDDYAYPEPICYDNNNPAVDDVRTRIGELQSYLDRQYVQPEEYGELQERIDEMHERLDEIEDDMADFEDYRDELDELQDELDDLELMHSLDEDEYENFVFDELLDDDLY